ncbi:MAG: hypothetical protein ACKO0V_18140 [bacterium]
MRNTAILLALLITSTGMTDARAGDKIRRVFVSSPQVVQTQYTAPQQVMVDRNAVAASPMLGSFVPNSTAWVRGNGVMGGGYTPLGQDERTSLTLYGPLAASRAQMRDVRVLQPTGYGTLRPVSVGNAAAYPNFPWSDSVPGLSGQNRMVRPRSPVIFPGWQTDSDTIDQQ